MENADIPMVRSGRLDYVTLYMWAITLAGQQITRPSIMAASPEGVTNDTRELAAYEYAQLFCSPF
jgi:hypothetical protein